MKFLKQYAIYLLVLWGVGFGSPMMAQAKGSSGEPRQIITITYKVRKGDTLQEIADKHDVSVKQLQRWNKGLDPRALKIGARLRIAVTNPEWVDWKQGKKRSSKKSHSAKKGHSSSVDSDSAALPPAKLEVSPAVATTAPRDARAELESMGLKLPEKKLPKAPKKATSRAASSKARGHETRPSTLSFDGEDLPVVDTLEELSTIPPSERVLYVVQSGENIGTIALKFRLDPEALMFWNNLEDLTPEAGKVLLLQSDEEPPNDGKPLPVVHRIKRGDSLQKIAKKYGVSVSNIKKWNKRINPRALKIGDTITMYIPGKDGTSQSYGSANRGRLYNGVPLETTTGLKVRTVANAYGTERVVRLLKAMAFDVKARWPEAPDMVVGDLSYSRGGRIKRHSSHQSGRDADISFFYRGNVQLPDFRDMVYETFDAPRNWHVFKTMIDTGEVEYIFIDYPLQRMLYEYALSIGYTEDELATLIQYPQPRNANSGIIRHVKGHDDHFHIRFKCGPLDRHCK